MIQTLAEVKQSSILNEYFPDQESFVDCIGDIHSIKEKGRATHLSEETSFKDQSEVWYKKYRKRKKNSNKFDFDKAVSKVKILKDFVDGEQLSQVRLLGLATNLYWISGGFKWMKKQMTQHNRIGETDYSEVNFCTLKYIRKKNKHLDGGYFKPMKLAQLSPHANDHDYKNILTSVRKPQNYVWQYEKPSLSSLSKSDKRLKKEYERFLQDDGNPIYLFICPPAIGKTRLLYTAKRVTIAFPTHDLKREKSEEMEAPHVSSPAPPEFINSDYNDRINFFNRSGIGAQTKFDYLAKLSDTANNSADRKKANDFLQSHNRTHTTNKTILTTHTRAVFDEYDHNTIIFDEDPLQDIVPINAIKVEDLKSLFELDVNSEASELFDNLYLKYTKMDEETIIQGEKIDLDLSPIEEELIDKEISVDIASFLEANYVFKPETEDEDEEILYYSKQNPLPNKKIAIMSSTCNPHIYKKLFGKKVKVVDLSNTEKKGDILQDTSRSYSKSSFKGGGLEKLIEETNKYPVPIITHMDFADEIEQARTDLYFGNCSGSNALTGLNIIVAGTPHKNNALYFLMAKTIGVRFEVSDTEFETRLIRHNGFEFNFSCFENKDMRNLQLHYIEADLIQAIGRARALRFDVTVRVYSDFPIPQAEFIHN